MTRLFTPVPYVEEFWADDHNLCLSSPPYSAEAINSELVLQELSPLELGSIDDADPLWSPTLSFLYKSSLVSISLGQRVWGRKQPVYGFNGLVQGAIKLSRKCTHIVRLEVSLLGRVKVFASNRAMISQVVDYNIVSYPVVLSSPPPGQFTPTEECFPFSIPFPSFVKGGTSPLPPSCATWSSTFSSEVEYCVTVDVYRKGLRRHELRVIPIMYLPKSWPSHPTPRRDSAFDFRPAPGAYRTIALPPVWPNDACPVANVKVTMPTLCFPSGVTYSSGDLIPLKVTVQSSEAPALVELLMQGVEAQLVKQTIAWAKGGQVLGGREIVVCKGNLIKTDTPQEGFAVSYFGLALGEPGKEQSWRVADMVEMIYLIRVTIRCPEGAGNFVPTYKHVSRIGLASEPWG
ncbi:hypothetical protein B0F90DRAFT_1808376 [Multifurca ochricompacta]|uniref:Arrestin-like N-terminal domain-containing protein n=1 Tax=Multifurca ochricompacta TaxID=376703 RepID=A0AAD4MBV9_9AGAM|nr:hypothetical protein B0F90DRAFT_1808376 [Multifurca ochricompacta]